jgi:Putative metal-binding motif
MVPGKPLFGVLGARRLRIVCGAAAAFAALARPGTGWGHRYGIEATDCSGCHGGGATPTVTLTAVPDNPAVGQAVTLTVTISQTNGPVAGFYLTTVDPSLTTVEPVGTFRAIEAGTSADSGGVIHTMPRTGSGGVTTFKATWSASTPTGALFLVNGMSANGDDTPRGDAPGRATLSITVGCAGAPYYLDQDGDGYGTSDPGFPVVKACSAPAGYAARAGDCDDFNAAIHPGAAEMCDGKDNNCDGTIDENVVYQPYCEDKDGDGHGIIGAAMKTDCRPSPGFGDCNGDCNDRDATSYPGAMEICDGRDNNCNGTIDEGVRPTCGTGWCQRYAVGCTTICTPGPPRAEVCNLFDDDCDGVIDNGSDAELCGPGGSTCVLGRCVPPAQGPDSGTVTGADGGVGLGRGAGGGCSLVGGAGTGGGDAAAAALVAIGLLARRRRAARRGRFSADRPRRLPR